MGRGWVVLLLLLLKGAGCTCHSLVYLCLHASIHAADASAVLAGTPMCGLRITMCTDPGLRGAPCVPGWFAWPIECTAALFGHQDTVGTLKT